jgi:hypothetical protein
MSKTYFEAVKREDKTHEAHVSLALDRLVEARESELLQSIEDEYSSALA